MRGSPVEQRWLGIILSFAGTALFNEAVLVHLARRTDDSALWYVTLKFVLLPAAAFALLIGGFVQVLRGRTRALRLLAGIGAGVAALYLAGLWWWPLPWFVRP